MQADKPGHHENDQYLPDDSFEHDHAPGNIGGGQHVAHADCRQRGQAEVNKPSGVHLVGARRGLPGWLDDCEAAGIEQLDQRIDEANQHAYHQIQRGGAAKNVAIHEGRAKNDLHNHENYVGQERHLSDEVNGGERVVTKKRAKTKEGDDEPAKKD